MLFWRSRDPEHLYPIPYRTHQVRDSSSNGFVPDATQFSSLSKTTSETKTGYSLTPRGIRKDIKKTTAEKTLELEISFPWSFFLSFSRTGNTKTLHLTTAFFEWKATFPKNFLKTLETYSEERKNIQIIKKIETFRRCFEEAETQNTCIPYRTHQVPEIAPPMVSYQMPHNFHLYRRQRLKQKLVIRWHHEGLGRTSKKQQRKKTLELEISFSWSFFLSFSRTGNTKTLHLTTAFFEWKATFPKNFLKTLKTYSEERKNIQIIKKIETFRRCFEEAETQNTCIPYRTHQVPEIAPPMVSYQMPHNFHLYRRQRLKQKLVIRWHHEGLGRTSKKQQRKKTLKLEISFSWSFFWVFHELGTLKRYIWQQLFSSERLRFRKIFWKH